MSSKPTPYFPSYPTYQNNKDMKLNKTHPQSQKGYPHPSSRHSKPSHCTLIGGQQIPMPGTQPGSQSGFSQVPGYPTPATIIQLVEAQATWTKEEPQFISSSGLGCLSTVDRLLVKQQLQRLEMTHGLNLPNKYNILDSNEQKIYEAFEDEAGYRYRECARFWWKSQRPFDMKFMDSNRNEVIHLFRPYRSVSCWCPCWLQIMEVTSPPGTSIGTIEQKWSIWKPRLAIKNAQGEVALIIKGPCNMRTSCCCCRFDVVFTIHTYDGEKVGEILKRYMGYYVEGLTNADNYEISFPMELAVEIKALLLGASILIDFIYFESTV